MWQEKTEETPRKTQTPTRPPLNPYEITDMRTRDLNDEKQVTNRLRNGVASESYIKILNI